MFRVAFFFLFVSLALAQRDPPFVLNVTDVTSRTPGGVTYGINSVLEFEVVFSGPIQVSNYDFLRLKINVWRDTVKAYAMADYVAPSLTPNTLRFMYVVRRRDFTPDYLDYIRYDSLSGGVIEPNVTLCKEVGPIGHVLSCPLLSTFLPPKGVASLFKRNILVWGFPPILVNVNSTSRTGIYGIGAVINIVVEFNAPVNVIRQRSVNNLLLNSDITNEVPTPVFATYVSGSGTKFLTFEYTVQKGQYASPLNYPEFTSLKDMVIRDNVNEADYTLPPPSTNTIRNLSIIADGIPPYPLLVTSTAQYRSLFVAGQAVTILVIYSEEIQLFNYQKMKLITNVGIYPISGASGNVLNFTFIVPANADTDELNYLGTTSIIPGGARVYDLGRNEGTFILPPANSEVGITGKNDFSPLGRLKIRISSTRPYFLTSSASTSGALTPSTTFTIAIVVSESLILQNTTTGNPYLVLNDGGIANFTQTADSGLVPGLIFTYTVPAKTTFFNIPIEIRQFVFDTTQASITNQANLPLNATGIDFDGPNLSQNSKIVFVPTIAPPDPPVSLTVTDVQIDSITLQWGRPADNGSPIFRYQVEKATGTDDFVIDDAVDIAPNDNSTVITYISSRFLIPGQLYFFRVAAQNKVFLSGYSNVVNATTLF